MAECRTILWASLVIIEAIFYDCELDIGAI